MPAPALASGLQGPGLGRVLGVGVLQVAGRPCCKWYSKILFPLPGSDFPVCCHGHPHELICLPGRLWYMGAVFLCSPCLGEGSHLANTSSLDRA